MLCRVKTIAERFVYLSGIYAPAEILSAVMPLTEIRTVYKLKATLRKYSEMHTEKHMKIQRFFSNTELIIL